MLWSCLTIYGYLFFCIPSDFSPSIIWICFSKSNSWKKIQLPSKLIGISCHVCFPLAITVDLNPLTWHCFGWCNLFQDLSILFRLLLVLMFFTFHSHWYSSNLGMKFTRRKRRNMKELRKRSEEFLGMFPLPFCCFQMIIDRTIVW